MKNTVIPEAMLTEEHTLHSAFEQSMKESFDFKDDKMFQRTGLMYIDNHTQENFIVFQEGFKFRDILANAGIEVTQTVVTIDNKDLN